MPRFLLIALIFSALTQAAKAQITYPWSKETNSIVTVLSDGISEPNSAAVQVLSDISVTLDKESDLRLLSMAGYGGSVNVRDLLLLRGTDLAILNNDILAYLDLAKALPDARRKIRLIAPLFHQSVFLFARQNVKSIDDLKGRKIGVSSKRNSRGITAKTIFGLLKINADFVELDDKELSKRIKGDLDAVLLYERDLAELRALGIAAGPYHVLPIPSAGPLSKVYLPKKLNKDALPGFTTGDSLETVQVSTLLAAFDWNARQGRYGDVVNFVQKFFALLPQIRARNPNSPFSRTDVKVEMPGWARFGPSEALVASASPVVVKEDTSRPIIPTSPSTPNGEALRLVVIARPPLTDLQKEDGGITLKLFTDALDAAGMPTSVQWVDGEKTLLESLLTNKTGDIGLFWQTPGCESPHNPTASEAAVCDQTVLSDPVMQVVIAVFTRLDTALVTETDTTQIRSLCVPEGQPVPYEALTAIPWIRAANVKTLRPRTLIDCFAAVDRRDVDAVLSVEPEGRFVIDRLKLSQSLQISQRSGVTTGLHAVVAKDNPRQEQLIKSINEAIAKFRSSDRYAAVIASHLPDLTGLPAKMP